MIDRRIEGKLIIVIAQEHCNPLAMIRTLGRLDLNPVYIGIRYKAPVASSSKYVKKYYPVDTDQEALDCLLVNYGEYYKTKGDKPFILLGDDSTVELFEKNYEVLKDRFVMFNAGGKGQIAKYMDKLEILECAKRHDIQILPTEVVERGQLPKQVAYPVITKAISPNSGAWKKDVFICNTEKELIEAFKQIKSSEVLIQQFLDKKTEVALEGFSINHGKDMFIGVKCTYLYNIKGYYSPYYINEPFKDDVLRNKLNAIFEEIGFEGMFEIEFLVGKNDELYFSEINFRNSPWSYSSTYAGNPLPYLWCLSMLSGKVPAVNDFVPFKSMVEPFDYAQRVERGNMPIAKWLLDFKQTECPHYYDPEDMGPYKVMCDNWDILK